MSPPETHEIRIKRLFRKTRFGIFVLFGAIVFATSTLSIRTVSSQLEEEYESNSANIAKNIADSSVDILLNRNLATLQSLIDQFVEIQSIRYIYITSDTGEILTHTFVPGVPEVIRESDPHATEPVERSLPGMGDFVEIGSPILAGQAGTVHVGMDLDLVRLKIQRATGQQIALICIILIVGVLGSIWFVRLAVTPLEELLSYVVGLARRDAAALNDAKVLARDDEIGEMARLMLHAVKGEASGAASNPGSGTD